MTANETLSKTVVILELRQTKQEQRAGCALTGTWQDAKLPVNFCEVQARALE